MTELVGFKELTPYKGGWCGNEIFADTFTDKIRAAGPRPDLPLRRSTAQGGLQRLLRARFPDRQGQRRGLPRRAEPAHHRRQLDHQPRRLRPRRRAAVPLPPAGVSACRSISTCDELNDRWAQAGEHRHLGPDGDQAHRRYVDRVTEAPAAASGACATTAAIYFWRIDYHRRSVEKEQRGLLPAHHAVPATSSTRAPTSASWSCAAA